MLKEFHFAMVFHDWIFMGSLLVLLFICLCMGALWFILQQLQIGLCQIFTCENINVPFSSCYCIAVPNHCIPLSGSALEPFLFFPTAWFQQLIFCLVTVAQVTYAHKVLCACQLSVTQVSLILLLLRLITKQCQPEYQPLRKKANFG